MRNNKFFSRRVFLAEFAYSNREKSSRSTLTSPNRSIATTIWIDLRGLYRREFAIAQGHDATK